eukprot:11207014-Lingulodinium_polyedra.AAC.1
MTRGKRTCAPWGLPFLRRAAQRFLRVTASSVAGKAGCVPSRVSVKTRGGPRSRRAQTSRPISKSEASR